MHYKEPKAMREIHQIRLKLYEEDRGLSTEERISKTNKIAKKFLKKSGLESRLVRKENLLKL